MNGKQPPAVSNETPVYVRNPKNKTIGLALLILPFLLLIVVLFLFGITKVVFSAASGGPESGVVIVSLLNIIFATLGLISVIAIPFGIVLGIIFLVKKEMPAGVNYDVRSGKGDQSEIPPEIKQWNWGALGLGWIWGIYHRVWISLLVFIPIVGFIFMFVLAYKGNEWAWKKEKYLSVEDFLARQKKWKPWGIAFFILILLSQLSRFTIDMM